uniref:F-box domain-containing protein n=1 Tax=Pithovirus LCPAC403 TaxID=2506596 RepID=A0A481ZBC8_9VIRU|nr:MAG: uncharacterized protein LCPAC403_03720 [Pithovirus LCPAC403]
MNTDRSVEELLKLFEVQNISQLGSDVIREFFNDISVKEVLKLCRVSKQFNIACNKESMWKKKVKNDYGITKLYGSTWKKTARLLFESDMINLNAHWVNGKTYKELFEEGLDDDRYFNDILLFSIVFPDYVTNIETAKDYLVNDPETIIRRTNVGNMSDREKETVYGEFNHYHQDILDDEKMLDIQITDMTRELSVVIHAVYEIQNYREFGLAQSAECENDLRSTSKQTEMNKRVNEFIDPMLYILSFCLMSRKNLSLLDISRI